MKRYKIRKFSEYMGVTVDTIKHYQQCGIINPEIDPENNYRYYNITHGERLIVTRKFRNLGFTIDETKELVSSKNGTEIISMLTERLNQTQEEIKKLENKAKNLDYLVKLCDLFNNHAGTYECCTRPSYYFYRHTYNYKFIEEGSQEALTKELMSQLPDAVKMMILPYESMHSPKNHKFFHTIAIREELSSCISREGIDNLEYIPECPAVRYIYSRPHSNDKINYISDIYDEIAAQGYHLGTSDIIVENAIDHYIDGIRYENYLIYFPLVI